MTDQPGGSQSAVSDAGQRSVTKLSLFETSFLEYVLAVHGNSSSRRACLIALLVHAQLLSRGARLSSSNRGPSSLISESVLDSDPIRLSYTLVPRLQSETLASAASQVNLTCYPFPGFSFPHVVWDPDQLGLVFPLIISLSSLAFTCPDYSLLHMGAFQSCCPCAICGCTSEFTELWSMLREQV